jgi:ribosomal protein L32
MAVPKKRTSKSKKNTRQFVWTNETKKASLKAISLGKCVLKGEFKKRVSKTILGFSKKEEPEMSKEDPEVSNETN